MVPDFRIKFDVSLDFLAEAVSQSTVSPAIERSSESVQDLISKLISSSPSIASGMNSVRDFSHIPSYQLPSEEETSARQMLRNSLAETHNETLQQLSESTKSSSKPSKVDYQETYEELDECLNNVVNELNQAEIRKQNLQSKQKDSGKDKEKAKKLKSSSNDEVAAQTFSNELEELRRQRNNTFGNIVQSLDPKSTDTTTTGLKPSSSSSSSSIDIPQSPRNTTITPSQEEDSFDDHKLSYSRSSSSSSSSSSASNEVLPSPRDTNADTTTTTTITTLQEEDSFDDDEGSHSSSSSSSSASSSSSSSSSEDVIPVVEDEEESFDEAGNNFSIIYKAGGAIFVSGIVYFVVKRIFAWWSAGIKSPGTTTNPVSQLINAAADTVSTTVSTIVDAASSVVSTTVTAVTTDWIGIAKNFIQLNKKWINRVRHYMKHNGIDEGLNKALNEGFISQDHYDLLKLMCKNVGGDRVIQILKDLYNALKSHKNTSWMWFLNNSFNHTFVPAINK